MRRHTVTVGLIGSLILLAACGSPRALGSGGPASAQLPSAETIAPNAGSADPEPMLAWTFGDQAMTEAGDVDLQFTGDYDFAGNAVSFDGRTGFGASVRPAPVDTTSSFSVSAWVSLADPGSTEEQIANTLFFEIASYSRTGE